MKVEGRALDWLLEDDEPSVRYLALTRLLGRSERDAEVRAAKKLIGERGWAADILARQHPGGWWKSEENMYRPKYVSSNWMLLVLSDLGLTRKDPRIRGACELWIERFSKKDGGFGADGWTKSHLCITGNTVRALIKFGYEDHPSVKSALEWLLENQCKNGGWSCFGIGSGNLDSWEPMSAFAALPREKWTKGMKASAERGAEFFLSRELHKQGAEYRPWYRFHYPVHYYYDVLVGLDFMTALGYGGDERLGFAISLLKKKMAPDGRWALDAVHPDVEGGLADWNKNHPSQAAIRFSLEKSGEPSKMITLRAIEVLSRLEP